MNDYIKFQHKSNYKFEDTSKLYTLYDRCGISKFCARVIIFIKKNEFVLNKN